jgi:hypothetical protein
MTRGLNAEYPATKAYFDDVTSRRTEFGFKEQLSYIALAAAFQKECDIRGSVGEIGLLGGEYFNMIAACAKPDEFAVGIDLFDDQSANVDGSGRHRHRR